MFTLITLWFIGNLYVFAVDADLKLFNEVNFILKQLKKIIFF